MRRIRQAVNRRIEQIQPDRPLISRRDLLKLSGLALGGAVVGEGLLGGRLRADSLFASSVPRIGIVGAGIAGMVAALTLQAVSYTHLQLGVSGTVDRAHAALSELGRDSVVRDAGGRGHCVR